MSELKPIKDDPKFDNYGLSFEPEEYHKRGIPIILSLLARIPGPIIDNDIISFFVVILAGNLSIYY